MQNFEGFLNECGKNRIFRMWELRRVGDWTPLEMEEKYIDQSQYKDEKCSFIQIREAYELPDGDVLLGVSILYDWEDAWKKDAPIEYKKLSQIEISWYPEDQDVETWV